MKIAIALNIQVYFCIFLTFVYTEGMTNKKINAVTINYLLHLPGWKNINDVEYIYYRCKQHKLNELINQTVTRNECDNFIRRATIFLGCSYAHDLNIMFYVLSNFQKHCLQLFFTGNWYQKYNCTVTLLAKINEIVPMAKFMIGALYAIEKHHTLPMDKRKRNSFILRKVLTNLQENEKLNKFVPSGISIDTIRDTLLSINVFIHDRKCDFEEDLSYCELKSLDLDSLWNLWIMEFDTLKSQGIYEELYILLSDKIKDLILTTIWKKYIELGFKFDLNTSRTFLPTPPTNEIEDTTQNLINLIDHTNEANMLQMVQQHDISQNPSINLIQHINEVNVIKNVLQEYIAQYSFINLMQSTNEVNKQDGIIKEDVSQNLSLNLTLQTFEENVHDEIQQNDVICEETDDSNLQIKYTDDTRPFYNFI
ncbi:uncharacterized protein LOC126894410 isoform X2 [Daktulosphaira vitifoliae]|uniref:uncharacterized protein LOC126894410 isoform X2 n=1 Tax=Daktulosphaira vitifoliae TaxID=58002 RepID=UPI0021A9A0D3|nr:uncharacterized protein LOC126894410 isoform X2 [Daktulosphaira vitifoliae]